MDLTAPQIENRLDQIENLLEVIIAGNGQNVINCTHTIKQGGEVEEEVTNNHIVNQKQKEVNIMNEFEKLKSKNIPGTYPRVRKQKKSLLLELRFYYQRELKSVYGKTAKSVEIKYRNWKPKPRREKKVEPKNEILTVDQWHKTYVEKYFAKRVKRKETVREFESNYRRRVQPVIGHMDIRKVETEHIQEIVHSMGDFIRQRTIVYNQVSQMFKKAQKTRRIDYNPCEEVEFERVNVINEGKAMTVEQQAIFERHCFENPTRETLAYLVYLSTGMRPSELLKVNGITDIDREKNTLHIKGTKTKASNAIVVFPKQTIDLIPMEEKPFNYQRNVLQNSFSAVCDELSFKDITLKSLRTTFATRCREAGLPEEVIKYYMRHTKTNTTVSYIRTQQDHVNNYINRMPFKFTQNLPQKNDEKTT